MLSLATRSFSQVLSPPFRAILWKSLGITVALLIVVWMAIQGTVVYFIDFTSYPWLETVIGILTGIGALIGLGFLIAPVSAIFAGLFQDEVADLVESQDYPADPPGKPMALIPSLWLAVKFAGVVILGNLIALILLLVPGINIVAFFLVNGYLLGREFFQFAAMRDVDEAAAKRLRKAHGGTVLLGGLLIAGVLAIPILNLLTPIFATVFMVHLYKRVRARTMAAAV
ncbi:sulfate transporter family protein [Breoghania sp. L-A4]|uniref:sulfate transporter family protein n=1 Tax=Breoghania sp. L-A4 TaxID=2304600 RepID=UPI000E35FFFE|nr:sulfate transporter family protein [Breoghania sp. L-A4]AXS39025.1 sulfate transporter family protein [Breoghania sp. L-A4]